ncbi:MAG: sulfite exporter TauE/SafE family protein [Myxococcota bacterium]|nr:sulfite exporter TauE/SafE family protein [Deltaproteobacteria bacterium]MDQ3333901.1 sulfite exporter TauE/SafE family protein [Myxococcota bacterium]
MILLAFVGLLAFTVEGAIGFGSTVVAVSLGAQLVPLEVLLPAFVPLNIVLSLTLLRRRQVQWRTLFVEIVPLVAVGIACGLLLSHVLTSRFLLVGFGAFVVALSVFELTRVNLRWSTPLLAIGGIVHGLFGTGGPMIVYVTRKKIADKSAFRATLAVLWIALNTILMVNFVAMERYPSPELMLVLGAAIIPGRLLGEYLHRALDAQKFERVVWVVLLVAGAVLALRSL